MRSREQDRQQWQDPDFNKWLDEAISDAGHIVWDAIPDVGSAWNGWDAGKAALGYYCPACNGSGEEIHVSYQGPESFERLGGCTTCGGDGRSSAALQVAHARLAQLLSEKTHLQGEVWALNHKLEQSQERESALSADLESHKRMLLAAACDIGAIGEALGADMDDDGSAIEGLAQEMAKDAERLDFLESLARSSYTGLSFAKGEAKGSLEALWFHKRTGGKPSLREAIDAAQKEVGGAV
ncbi:TPA: hypothetical protein ACG3DQ_002587 [Pseudomonas putida]